MAHFKRPTAHAAAYLMRLLHMRPAFNEPHPLHSRATWKMVRITAKYYAVFQIKSVRLASGSNIMRLKIKWPNGKK